MKALSLSKLLVLLCGRFDHFLCRTLPGPIRFRWAKLWVREDEFHPSLDFHAKYAYKLSDEEYATYSRDLVRRRQIAHERDLANS